jgi:molecular chaperone GrpE
MTGDGRFPGPVVRDRRWWAHPEEQVEERSNGAEPPQVEGPLGALEDELASRDQRLRDALVRERQAMLEVDRARARLERDARREIERSRHELIVALLPVLDDLDRAIAAAIEAAAPAALVTGVELVRSGFLDRLRRFDVERFEPAPGDEFDPARHEAVSAVDGREAAGRWLITETLRPGYVAGNETIRPAQVIVRRAELRS